jgi:hypothetical protein
MGQIKLSESISISESWVFIFQWSKWVFDYLEMVPRTNIEFGEHVTYLGYFTCSVIFCLAQPAWLGIEQSPNINYFLSRINSLNLGKMTKLVSCLVCLVFHSKNAISCLLTSLPSTSHIFWVNSTTFENESLMEFWIYF